MIKGNTLKFGYGDIGIGAVPARQALVFQQIENCKPFGYKIFGTEELIGEKVIIDIEDDNYPMLNTYLKQIRQREITFFTFKGYTFDFENYNEKSVDVFERKLEEAMYYYILCLGA